MTDVVPTAARSSTTTDDDFKDLEAGETTALLPGDEKTEDKAAPPKRRSRLKENAVKGAAVLSTGTSVATLVIMGANPLTLVSGGIGAVIAPYAAMQETKIGDLEALKEINEKLSDEVNQLGAENDRLLKQMKELEESVANLEEMQEALTVINKTESQSVEEMEKNLEKSKKILDSMETNMKATVLQNIVSVVLRSDLDGDHTLDDNEIDLLFRKLDAYDTVEVKEEMFRQTIINEGRSLTAIMSVIKNVLSDDIPDDQQIIRILGV